MGKRSFTLSMVVIALVSATLQSPAQGAAKGPRPAHQRDFDHAQAKAKKDGRVSVLVGLATTFAPEGKMTAGKRGTQRSSIAQKQQDVRNDLKGHSFNELHSYETVPLISLSLSEKAVARLRESENVTSVTIDAPRYKPTLAQSSPLVEAEDMWTAGTTGAGTTVAILDTGVDTAHPFFDGRVVEEACYSGGGFSGQSVCPNGQSSQTGSGSGVPCPVDCAHGTHVAGIAAGAGATSSGVAKGANIMSVQVFSDDGSAYTSDIIKALERVYAVRSTHGVAVNMSLGGANATSPCTGEPERFAIANLLAAGIPTAIATGNDGRVDRISSPACIPDAIAVASSTKSDGISGFSNNHPTMTDLVAPGSNISSSVPGGGFGTLSGTSMATPHVAGAFALLREAHPSATVAAMLSVLKTTGIAIQDNGYTRPRIRIAQASVALAAGGGGGGGGGGTTRSVVFSIGGAGRGGISGDGIACAKPQSVGNDCFESYADGTVVTVFAIPSRGSRFVGWTGDFAACGRSRGCELESINADYVATARFKRI